MKKYVLIIGLVVFGGSVAAQEKPINSINTSKKVEATASKKACCSETNAKPNCSEAENKTLTETDAEKVAKSEVLCCKDSKSTSVASAKVTSTSSDGKAKAVATNKKSCCSQSSAKSNCSSSKTKQ